MLDIDTRVTTAADRESEGVGEVVEDVGEIVVVETEQEVCDPPDPPIIMAFVDENGTDGADALNKAITALKNFSYDPNDLKFTFGQMEIKMKAAGVKKQFTKLQTLTTVLPKEVIDEIKPLLRKDETEFENNDSYKQAKVRIMEIFGQSDEEPFERAMGRVLTGKPSQLARAIVNDVCDRELNGCCCHKWVGGQWKRNLPTDVKQHIADMPFTADNFNNIMKSADNAFGSTRPAKITPAIAAVVPSTPPADPSLDQAFHPAMPWPQHPTEIAAYGQRGGQRGRGRGAGGRAQRGQGRGGGQNRGQSSRGDRGQGVSRGSGHPRHKTQRHADQPPFESCFRHWTFGKQAHFCQEPASCPWKDVWVPKSNQ